MKDILLQIRKQHNLSQEQFAEKLYITRQAVSRWETGKSVPNIDTLKLISEKFGVSADQLLKKNDQPLTDSKYINSSG